MDTRQSPASTLRHPSSSRGLQVLLCVLFCSHLIFPWCSHLSLCEWKFAEDKDVMIVVLPGGSGSLAESIYFVIQSKIPFVCSQINKT